MLNINDLIGFGVLVNAPAAGGAWEFVAASTPAIGTNAVAALPSGWQQGDLLIIVVSCKSNTITATPSGFTARHNTGGAADPRILICDKIAGSSESNVTVATTNSADAVVMLAYRNINQSSQFDVVGTLTEASTATISTTSLTTTQDNDLVISVYVVKDRAGAWTAPADTTVRVNLEGNSLGTNNGMLIVDENKATAGATTARTATGAAQNKDAIAIAYKQA